MVEPPAPVRPEVAEPAPAVRAEVSKHEQPVVTDPVAVLLAGQPALLESIIHMATEELRTLEAQTIWCLREYLAIHAEAVRLAARRLAEASAATEAQA
jgi:hypothetical protein